MVELPRKRITGYADPLSARPGETVRVMASCDGVERYRAGIVRLIAGDLHPEGAGFKERPVATAVDGDYPGRWQPIHAGSFAVVDDAGPFDRLHGVTLQAFIRPTLAGRGRQIVMGRWSDESGYALAVEDGQLALLLGGGGAVQVVASGVALEDREWYLAAAAYDAAAGVVQLWQAPLTTYATVERGAAVEAAATTAPAPGEAPFTLAAAFAGRVRGRPVGLHHFNGKIDRPRVAGRALDRGDVERLAGAAVPAALETAVIAAWDLARDIPTTRIRDLSANRLDGELINLPARAMTGHNWTGAEHDWRRAPDQYGAVHFHEDDLYDANWEPDFEFAVPDDMPSGVYAAKLESPAGDVDHVPFFVRPAAGRPTADAALLVPVASYLAYANEHASFDTASTEALADHLPSVGPEDLFLNAHREYGLSMYDLHADGSGVCVSSRLRPILNMRPGHTLSWVGIGGSHPWQFNADLAIVDWLDATGHACDVITDEDLDAEGVALLGQYRVVLTGTHPEYHSTAQWDAIDAYLERGGRLMYLGGNGFYWRVAWHPTLPGVIELRRAEDGIRDWEAEPGEYYHAFTGEYGGLWRRLGRPPQRLVGVGMAAQGFDVSSRYRRTDASRDPRAAFIFDDVADEVIGDFGVVGGGAAGLELDRADRRLGTPPHALVVARSEGHTDHYFPGPEEVNSVYPDLGGYHNPNVRADMVFFETANGGAVFSTGSISWAGSLCHNAYDNNVSKITGNVLKRFRDPEPFA